jgi:hypothetical protein
MNILCVPTYEYIKYTEMPQFLNGGGDNSKRREVSLKGEGAISADGDNNWRAYLRGPGEGGDTGWCCAAMVAAWSSS